MSVALSNETVETLAAFVERSDLERMQVVADSKIPVRLRTGAVTFGDRVFFRAGKFDESTPAGLALIAHESRHIGQYAEYGFVGFLARYLWGAVRSGFAHARHPMEVELIAEQASIKAALEAI